MPTSELVLIHLPDGCGGAEACPHAAPPGRRQGRRADHRCLRRAAAYSKLGNYAGAVQDCERAICIDPAYSKAYGRMG